LAQPPRRPTGASASERTRLEELAAAGVGAERREHLADKEAAGAVAGVDNDLEAL